MFNFIKQSVKFMKKFSPFFREPQILMISIFQKKILSWQNSFLYPCSRFLYICIWISFSHRRKFRSSYILRKKEEMSVSCKNVSRHMCVSFTVDIFGFYLGEKTKETRSLMDIERTRVWIETSGQKFYAPVQVTAMQRNSNGT